MGTIIILFLYSIGVVIEHECLMDFLDLLKMMWFFSQRQIQYFGKSIGNMLLSLQVVDIPLQSVKLPEYIP